MELTPALQVVEFVPAYPARRWAYRVPQAAAPGFVDLRAYSFRSTWTGPCGVLLFALTSSPPAGLTVDATGEWLTLLLTAPQAAQYAAARAAGFDLVMTDAAGVDQQLVCGRLVAAGGCP